MPSVYTSILRKKERRVLYDHLDDVHDEDDNNNNWIHDISSQEKER